MNRVADEVEVWLRSPAGIRAYLETEIGRASRAQEGLLERAEAAQAEADLWRVQAGEWGQRLDAARALLHGMGPAPAPPATRR